MKAVLLAAGEGKRLRPLTDRVPKPMLPLMGKPLLEHHLLSFARFGINDVLINLHHLPDVIKSYFGDGERWGVRITYFQEQELLGTAGALRPMIKELSKDLFFVVYGDNYVTCDFAQMKLLHLEKKAFATVAFFEGGEFRKSGVMGIDDELAISHFVEKPTQAEIEKHQPRFVNAGIYMLEPEIFDYIPQTGISDFGTDIFPKLIAHRKRVVGYPLRQPVYSIDTLSHYRSLQKVLAGEEN